MGDQFIIQVPYNVITNPNNHLSEVNLYLAKFLQDEKAEFWEFDVLYSLAQNTETGKIRVEGKVKTGDSRLDIEDFQAEIALINPVFNGAVQHPKYIPLYDLSQCVEKVIGWSKERGILDNGVWYTQSTKLYEEDGEAATGISKNKKRLIMDGIGDSLVVLVNLMELTGLDASRIPVMLSVGIHGVPTPGNAHHLFHKMRKFLTEAVDDLWAVAGIDSPKKLDASTFPEWVCVRIDRNIVSMLSHALALANSYEMSLEQCFSLAWDEIKDRKGFLNADGIFIKEADAE